MRRVSGSTSKKSLQSPLRPAAYSCRSLPLGSDFVRLAAEWLGAADLGELVADLLDHVIELGAALLDQCAAWRAAHLPGGKGARARRLDLDGHSFHAHVAEARGVEMGANRRLVMVAVRDARELHLRIAGKERLHDLRRGLGMRIHLDAVPDIEKQRSAFHQDAP